MTRNNYKLRCDKCKLPIRRLKLLSSHEYIHDATIQETIERSLKLNLPVNHWIISEVI